MATTKVQHPCSGNVHVDVVLSMLLRFEFTKLHYHLKFLSGRFLFFQTMRFESSRIAFQTAGFACCVRKLLSCCLIVNVEFTMCTDEDSIMSSLIAHARCMHLVPESSVRVLDRCCFSAVASAHLINTRRTKPSFRTQMK
jgi:hypothetical protein